MVKKMPSKGMKMLKIFHLVFSFIWFVGALLLFIISLFLHPENSSEALIYAQVLDFIDTWLIILGANGVFFTGLLYGIWTKWGFVKHRWILLKWIIVVVLILYGVFTLKPLVKCNIHIAETMKNSLSEYPLYFENLTKISIGGSIQLAFLLYLIYISVFKPFKTGKVK